MSRTKKAFIWTSVLGGVLFSFGVLLIGTEIKERTGDSGTFDRYFMLIWLGAALLILNYFIVRGVHANRPPGGFEFLTTFWMAGLYTGVMWQLASWLAP